jgi:hypothetical protein
MKCNGVNPVGYNRLVIGYPDPLTGFSILIYPVACNRKTRYIYIYIIKTFNPLNPVIYPSDLRIYSINNPLSLSHTSHIQPTLNCSLCFQPIDFLHSPSTLDFLSSHFICSPTSYAWLQHIPYLLISSPFIRSRFICFHTSHDEALGKQ